MAIFGYTIDFTVRDLFTTSIIYTIIGAIGILIILMVPFVAKVRVLVDPSNNLFPIPTVFPEWRDGHLPSIILHCNRVLWYY